VEITSCSRTSACDGCFDQPLDLAIERARDLVDRRRGELRHRRRGQVVRDEHAPLATSWTNKRSGTYSPARASCFVISTAISALPNTYVIARVGLAASAVKMPPWSSFWNSEKPSGPTTAASFARAASAPMVVVSVNAPTSVRPSSASNALVKLAYDTSTSFSSRFASAGALEAGKGAYDAMPESFDQLDALLVA
jgi:hypothetical protein